MSIFVHQAVFSSNPEISQFLEKAEKIQGTSITKGIDEKCICAVVNLVDQDSLDTILEFRQKEFFVFILIEDENSEIVIKSKKLHLNKFIFTFERFKVFFKPEKKLTKKLNNLEKEFIGASTSHVNPFRNKYRRFICEVILRLEQWELR